MSEVNQKFQIKDVNIKNIPAIVMKKTTWTPNEKDHGEIDSLKEFIDTKIDSYTLVDEGRNEYKLTVPTGTKKLDFGDKGNIKIIFEKD